MSEPVIGLEEQERLYEERFEREVEKLKLLLACPGYVAHIKGLGEDRLRGGYPVFGDDMYRWHAAVRESNQDEELADYIVYGTSA